MATEYYKNQKSATTPAKNWAALTPHDSTNFSFVPKAIQCTAGTGTFVAVGADGDTATFYASPGAWLPICPVRINLSTLSDPTLAFTGLKD